jgi:tetratricopeptide (TPR) repeat protein
MYDSQNQILVLQGVHMANIAHIGISDRYRLAQTIGKELGNRTSYTPEEFIAAGERAATKYPNEWIVFYALADKYQELGYYTEGLRAAQKCVELRPKDIRAVYALATSYNLITRAAWSENEDEAAEILQIVAGERDKVDRRLAQGAIDRTGLAVDTAASQAIRWFERALTLNPDNRSRVQIQWDLATLYNRFPLLTR